MAARGVARPISPSKLFDVHAAGDEDRNSPSCTFASARKASSALDIGFVHFRVVAVLDRVTEGEFDGNELRIGRRVAKVIADTGNWTLEVVERTEMHKFVVVPKRWIVEPTFAWISRNRRLARDFERNASTVVTFIRLAMTRIMLRRLTRPKHCS